MTASLKSPGLQLLEDSAPLASSVTVASTRATDRISEPVNSVAGHLDDVSPRINRELSLLAFNERVLAQAEDEKTPLLERLFFVTVCSTNLDEFFEIRVSRLKQEVMLDLPSSARRSERPKQVLAALTKRVHKLVSRQYALLNKVLLPALRSAGVVVSRRSEWDAQQRAWVRRYFREQVLPLLTPMGLDPAHPFPNIQNKILNFMITLEGRDAFGRDGNRAVVQVPRTLPRLIRLPSECAACDDHFVLLSSVIHENMDLLFPGMQVTSCYQFRVTRDSDLWVDEEEVDDLKGALEGELIRRPYGDAVRLEVAQGCPQTLRDALLKQFGLGADDLYTVDGPVNLHRLQALLTTVERPELKHPTLVPSLPDELQHGADIFEVLRRGDVLCHQPYEGFAPVLELLRRAADDPDVLAIKMTVYRTGSRSPVADILVEAARAGKEVTAVIELRARFDESANIRLASRLHNAGATVSYGVVGHKTHCKMLMVVRREDGELRRYVHLSTGNYHSGTAKVYTDLGLLTSRPEVCGDVHNVFTLLTGLGRNIDMECMLQAPFTLHETLCRLIEDEIEAAKRGQEARIIAKMNALTEDKVIQQLYRASQAGVDIDLIVRGICCLRPGVPGVSERIRVRSVIGRFLEHSRVYFFHAGGKRRVFCASADWMGRNFFRRVEVAWELTSRGMADRVFSECLHNYLRDNCQAWELRADGSYVALKPAEGEPPHSSQGHLLRSLAETD